MAAAAFAKTMGSVVDITLVESDSIGTVGVGEATIPPLLLFNRLLDINEADFMRATKATFKLGINFENWKDVGQDYFHSFGYTGKDHWTSGFQHFWRKGIAEGHAKPYAEYCLELLAALQGKFAHLPDQSLNYAYHLDSSLYAKFLRKLAEENGVKRFEGKIKDVTLNSVNGNISALHLESGDIIGGDLFIDCTGFRSILLGKALGTEYIDWSHYLPCDSAVAVQTKSVGPAKPYTRAIAHDAGWQWRIPLQHRTGNGLVYCSKYLDKDTAHDRLMANIEGETLTNPLFIKFQTGTRRKHWVKNCIALGLSSGFMEPLESTSIHLIQRGIIRLMRMLPFAEISPTDVEEFNSQTEIDMDQIRDFLILHYCVTERRDSDFWKYCTSMEIPDSLQHKIQLFKETGRVFRKDGELFAENSWVQVMMGQGILPNTYHPIVDKMKDGELNRFLEGIRMKAMKTAKGLPEHGAYVRQFCGAKD
jgi:tryptophan halogenase